MCDINTGLVNSLLKSFKDLWRTLYVDILVHTYYVIPTSQCTYVGTLNSRLARLKFLKIFVASEEISLAQILKEVCQITALSVFSFGGQYQGE